MAMSIAVTPVVRALVRGRFTAEARAGSVTPPAEGDAAPAEADSAAAEVLADSSKVRRVAWAVVLLLGWGFSYSIGWSKGWTAGAADADARFQALSQCMINLPQAQAATQSPAATDAPANAFRTSDALETATAAEQGSAADGANGRL
jgi:hypothetical protein